MRIQGRIWSCKAVLGVEALAPQKCFVARFQYQKCTYEASQSQGQHAREEGEGCTNSHALDISWTLVRGKGICSQERLWGF